MVNITLFGVGLLSAAITLMVCLRIVWKMRAELSHYQQISQMTKAHPVETCACEVCAEVRKRYVELRCNDYFCIDTATLQPDGTCKLIGRNGDASLKLGEKLGGKEIIKIEAYGKELPEMGQGMTGTVTLLNRPSLVALKSDW